MLGSKEHYDIIDAFERSHSGLRLDRESKEFWSKGHVYQNGEANSLFLAYREGVSFAKAYYRDNEIGFLPRAGISDETKAQLQAIDENIRNAAALSAQILVGNLSTEATRTALSDEVTR